MEPSSTSPQEISVNSDKYKMFMHWLSENNCGWHDDFATYEVGGIKQGDFTLFYRLGCDWVVISFPVKNGKAKQYVKGIKEGELDFLLK